MLARFQSIALRRNHRSLVNLNVGPATPLRYAILESGIVESLHKARVHRNRQRPRANVNRDLILLGSIRAEFDATTSTTETGALFGHFRAVPLRDGQAPVADARSNTVECTTTRDTASAHAFSEV